MAYADPQTITVNAVPFAMARIGSGLNTGEFQTSDGNGKLTVAHSYGRRTRRVIRFDHRKIAADPLISAQNIQYSMSTSLIVDVPVTGFTVAEAKYDVDGLLAWLSASSGAKITQMLGGEN